MAAALGEFWDIHAHYREAQRWLEPALEFTEAAPPLRAKGLAALAKAALRRSDFVGSRELIAEAVDLLRGVPGARKPTS